MPSVWDALAYAVTVLYYHLTAHHAPALHINSIIRRPNPPYAWFLVNVKPSLGTMLIIITISVGNARAHVLIVQHRNYVPNVMQVDFYFEILVWANVQMDILDIVINVEHAPINVKPV